MLIGSSSIGTLTFWRSIATVSLALLLIGSARPAVSAEPSGVSPHPPPVYTQGPNARQSGDAAAAFLKRIREQGSLPVIVGLRMKLQPEDGLSQSQSRAQGEALARMQSRIAAQVQGQDQTGIKRYRFIPFMALRVNEARFRRLLADPDVASIQEDIDRRPKLHKSVPLIHGTDLARKFGLSGNGQVIAVLDAGVSKSHPMLAGKVVSEACYSTNDPAGGKSSFCPRKVTSSTASGSGVNCPASIEQCNHGTHVASIAAGAAAGGLKGVASRASIISIQIMSKVTKVSECGSVAETPCITTSTSDMVKGLERVFDLRRKYNIAALNMSFGGGDYPATCDDVYPAEAAALLKLRQAGISPVAASGNDGSDTDIDDPGCLSAAITVSGSTKGDKAKQVEYVADFANLNSLVEIAAPGAEILAAVPPGAKCTNGGGPYCELSGTSMAAPHVAGAIAVLREAAPRATVDQILNALQCSGKMVELTGATDNAYRLAVPRIDLLGAYNWLKKIPNRSFNFDTTAQAFDWSPVSQTWAVKDGRYSPTYDRVKSPDGAISLIGGCSPASDVSADMIREYPRGGIGDPVSQSGIVLNTEFNYVTRQISGYFFLYLYHWSVADPNTRGRAYIYRVTNFSGTLLCEAKQNVPIKDQRGNKIRAVNDNDTLKMYINGTLVCSAPYDGAYQSGVTSLYTDFSTLWTGMGGTFKVDNVAIKTLPVASARASAKLAGQKSASPDGGVVLIGAGRAPD